MQVSTATTTDRSLLPAVRTALRGADEALLCVAFVSEQGVHLLSKELRQLGPRASLLVTTAFGSTRPAALDMARGFGTNIAVLNPGGSSTYHPKLYAGTRADGSASAVIGSSNLTGGLVSNVEVATALSGTLDDAPLRDAWAWARRLWDDDRVQPWEPDRGAKATGSTFDPVLFELLRAEVRRDPVFMTLGRVPKRNMVTELTPTEVYVETDRTAQRGTGAAPVPAWMFELAWDYLRAHGELANTYLLNELNVKRSSAVCAILGRLPCVKVVSSQPIVLGWRG